VSYWEAGKTGRTAAGRGGRAGRCAELASSTELSSRAERGIFSAGSELGCEGREWRARSLVASAPRDDSTPSRPSRRLREKRVWHPNSKIHHGDTEPTEVARTAG